MKKMLSLIAAALMCAGQASAQTMKEIPHYVRFHAMSDNGKYLLGVEQGYIGIYDTETEKLKEWSDPEIGYDLGMGNMVTNDGFLVGCVNGVPSILDIEGDKWTPLGIKEGEENIYSCANCITPSRKYVAGYMGATGITSIKPVIWTQNGDGTYGLYEELPYPEKDFSGAAPKYILPNCISADGTVIAAQLMTQENDCLPMVYRRAADGSWTYEVYDDDVCEPGTVFPEHPGAEPTPPHQYDFMTEEEIAAYRQDSTEYEDSCWAYNIGDSDEWPVYWPDVNYYMTAENKALFDEALEQYNEVFNLFWEKLMAYRNFYYENVDYNFYTQNGVWLSPNGKYYAATGKKTYNKIAGDATLLTIGADGIDKHDYEDGLYGYCTTDDGDFFVSDGGTAYVYPAGSTERATLPDWLRSKGEDEAADWLDNVATGTAICSGDGRVLSGFTGASGSYVNWIIKLDDTTTGIDEIMNTADPAATVKVYDLQGRLVKECPAAEATDGLTKGVYVIGNRKVAVK